MNLHPSIVNHWILYREIAQPENNTLLERGIICFNHNFCFFAYQDITKFYKSIHFGLASLRVK